MRHRISSAPRSLSLLASLALALAVALTAGVAAASHYNVADVPTLIGAAEAQKLQKAGVTTTEELLNKAATAKDRKALAKSAGISGDKLTALARRSDLLRIKGVGPEMVLLLEAAGVKTTADLAKQEPAALETATGKANKQKKITEKPPTEPQFQDWIAQAKKLPPVLEAP